MQTPKVYILILNYNSWEDSIECLENILQQDYQNYQIVLIDNASPDGSMQHIQSWADKTINYFYTQDTDLQDIEIKDIPDKLILIQSQKNDGFAAGNNIFLQKARSEDAYVWLLNPDMSLNEDTLTQLIRFAQNNSTQSIIGCTLKKYNSPEETFLVGGAKINTRWGTVSFIQKPNEIDQLDYIHGGALCTHLSNFELLGVLPEDYFLYWEEADWCYQAKLRGFQLLVCIEAVAFDKIGGSVGRGYLAEYYYTRNALIFAKKYFKSNIPFILFFNTLRFAKRILQGNWQRAKAIFKGSLNFMTSK